MVLVFVEVYPLISVFEGLCQILSWVGMEKKEEEKKTESCILWLIISQSSSDIVWLFSMQEHANNSIFAQPQGRKSLFCKH